MTRGTIKQAIKDGVDDQSIADALLNAWAQAADEKVQIWRPPADHDQSFDYWDYLKSQQPYTSVANQDKYPLPDGFRAFIELKIAGSDPNNPDKIPYKLIDFRDRENYADHAVYILGGYFYPIRKPSADGQTMTFSFARMSDEFASDNDEPEVERIYHQAHVEWGKKLYYNQQGDVDLERQAEANFEKIMMGKWRDQEMARMASAADSAAIQTQFIV